MIVIWADLLGELDMFLQPQPVLWSHLHAHH
jgi:hypothetical protein